MGESVSRPQNVEMESLLDLVDIHCRAAAEAIDHADVMLITIGAGFSADSGLATFQDIAKVSAYSDRGLQYQDLCRPDLLLSDPELFYGFWGSCFNAYRRTQPNSGYNILKRWHRDRFLDTCIAKDIQKQLAEPLAFRSDMKQRDMDAGGLFVITSNIDSHCLDFFEQCCVREYHGSIELWQCGAKDGPCCGQTWAAPQDFTFTVDATTALAVRVADVPKKASTSIPSMRHPTPTVWRQHSMLRCVPVNQKFVCSPDEGWPCCHYCGQRARPAVLMFDDTNWIEGAGCEKGYAEWRKAVINVSRKWKRKARRSLRATLLEIGCGMNVTTMRQATEDAAEDFSKAGIDVTVVRINPEHPLLDRKLQNIHDIPLPCKGLETLQRMEAILLLQRCPSSSWPDDAGFDHTDDTTESSDSDSETNHPVADMNWKPSRIGKNIQAQSNQDHTGLGLLGKNQCCLPTRSSSRRKREFPEATIDATRSLPNSKHEKECEQSDVISSLLPKRTKMTMSA